jgi:hypothetical protein
MNNTAKWLSILSKDSKNEQILVREEVNETVVCMVEALLERLGVDMYMTPFFLVFFDKKRWGEEVRVAVAELLLEYSDVRHKKYEG